MPTIDIATCSTRTSTASTTADSGDGSTISDGRPARLRCAGTASVTTPDSASPSTTALIVLRLRPELRGQRGARARPVDVQAAQERGPVVPARLVGAGSCGAADPGPPPSAPQARFTGPFTADRRRDSTSTPAASSSTSAVHDEHHRGGLPEQAEPVLDRGQHRATDHRVADPAPPAEQRRAADHRRADGEQQRVAATRGRRDRADLRRVDDRADRRERRGDHEHRGPDLHDVDARAPGGLPVAAHGVDVPAELGAVQHERARDQQQQHDRHDVRDARDRQGAERPVERQQVGRDRREQHHRADLDQHQPGGLGDEAEPRRENCRLSSTAA